jgi:hypothetical protein
MMMDSEWLKICWGLGTGMEMEMERSFSFEDKILAWFGTVHFVPFSVIKKMRWRQALGFLPLFSRRLDLLGFKHKVRRNRGRETKRWC